MSEQTETAQPSATEQQLAQVNQVVSNAVASLMDVANLLRDIPKLVAASQALVQQLQKAGLSPTGEELTKPSAEA